MSKGPKTVRISEEMQALLDTTTEATGKSEAQVIRDAIESALTKPCKRCKGSGKEPGK